MAAIAYHHQIPATYRRRRAVAGALVLVTLVVLVVLVQVGARLLADEGATTHTGTVHAGTTATSATVLVPDPAAFGASGVALPAGATYVVQPGDTLWSIARALAPHDDVTATVARLRDLNGSSAVQVGQRLRLG